MAVGTNTYIDNINNINIDPLYLLSHSRPRWYFKSNFFFKNAINLCNNRINSMWDFKKHSNNTSPQTILFMCCLIKYMQLINDVDYFPLLIDNLLLCYYTVPLHHSTSGFEAAAPTELVFNLINLIWYLKWTDRCSCPHWEILYLYMFKCILISQCLSGIKTLSYDLSSNVNMYTYTGLKLRCFQILKGKWNYLSAQGAQTDSAGEQMQRSPVLRADNRPTVSAIHSSLIRFQRDYFLSVSDDQLFGLSKQTKHIS